MAPQPDLEADYVIVGAGAAGCVLANRLTADRRHRVVLLEAGGADRRLLIRVPAGFAKVIFDPTLNWGYATAPGAETGGRRIPFPRGRVLGGSSSINGHLYVRGQPADFDHWAQLGCRGWSYDDVLPYFVKAETRPGGDPRVRGQDGPLSVADPRERHLLMDAFLAAAAAAGLAPNPDYNAGEQDGSTVYQQLMRRGRRWSAADAYLRPARARPNLRIITGALAERILLEGRRATGVRFRAGGAVRTVHARREVLLAAGAINSPQLLQLSGIGDGARLRALGLEVAHHLPGVGEALRDHYSVRTAHRLRGTGSLNERAHGWRLWLEVADYLLRRRGLLAMSPSHGGGFARTRPELASPDIQMFFSPASYADGAAVERRDLERLPGMTCGVSQLRPESRGWVRIVAPDPTAAPEIQPNYLADPLDQATLVAGIKLVRRIFAAPPLARLSAGETFPGPAAVSDADLLAHARATGSTTFHPIGSCHMGSDPGAVVDPSLRVVGLDGLRVIDASIMPTMPSGNTYAPTIMVAEKGADLVLASGG